MVPLTKGKGVWFSIRFFSFLLYKWRSNLTLETVKGCVSSKKKKSQDHTVEVTVNSKEKKSQDFCLDFV